MSLTPEQFAVRRTGITSTDITRIVGESPWGGPCDVYTDKISEAEPRPPTLPQRIGDFLEPFVCELIREQFALAPLGAGETVRHPVMEWVLATPDRFAPATSTHGRAVVEAKVKSVQFHRREEWLDEEAPPPWVHVQCQWHMIATRTPVCYTGVLLGATPHFWIVESDAELAGALLEAGQAFQEKHVIPRIPPPVDGSSGARRMIAAVWPRHRAGMVRASPEAEEAARQYFEATLTEKGAKGVKELAAQTLAQYAGENEGVTGDGWRLLLKWREPVSVAAHEKQGYRHFDLRATKGGTL